MSVHQRLRSLTLVLAALLALLPGGAQARWTSADFGPTNAYDLRHVCTDGIIAGIAYTPFDNSDGYYDDKGRTPKDLLSVDVAIEVVSGTPSAPRVAEKITVQLPYVPGGRHLPEEVSTYGGHEAPVYYYVLDVKWQPENYPYAVGDNVRVALGSAVFTKPVEACRIDDPVDANIDVRPRTNRNWVLPHAPGWLPVLVEHTEDFGANRVALRPRTVRFGAQGHEAKPLFWWLRDADGDGDRDLYLVFRMRDAGLACGDRSATLTGRTVDGFRFVGRDAVVPLGC